MSLLPYRKKDPWSTLFTFQKELDNFFRTPFENATEYNSDFKFPAVNIIEDEKSLHVEAELAGFDENEVKLKLKDNHLIISAEHHEEKKKKKRKYRLQERLEGSYYREITLPSIVDTEKVKAKYKNGILKISFSKKSDKSENEITVSIES